MQKPRVSRLDEEEEQERAKKRRGWRERLTALELPSHLAVHQDADEMLESLKEDSFGRPVDFSLPDPRRSVCARVGC